MPSNSQIHPDGVTDAQENEVAARVTRRRFTAAQKARILDEYEHASAIERAAICRREHIYSSHLSNWRKQRAIGKPLEAKRGRRADPQAVEITQLRKRNVDLEQRLAKAEQVIDVQGKVYADGPATVAEAVTDLAIVVGEREACAQVGYSRASFQRRYERASVAEPASESIPQPESGPQPLTRQQRRYRVRQARRRERHERLRRSSSLALTAIERRAALDAVHEPQFIDRSVPHIYAALLDDGRYLGSMSTMYRVLRDAGEVGDRRDQATRPAHVKPELCAQEPGRVWCWDITKLHGPHKWTYLCVPQMHEKGDQHGLIGSA